MASSAVPLEKTRMSRRLVTAALALVVAACSVARPGRQALADDAAAPTSLFKNVKVLTHVKSKAEMREIMKAQSAALGVKCSHCHVPGKFELDDKKEKQTAREMMKMVNNLNTTVFKDFEEKPAISCWSCHRGATEVERTIPQSAFDKVGSQE